MRHIIPIMDSHNNGIGQEATVDVGTSAISITTKDGRTIRIERKYLDALLALKV